jgi:hypothetical protein
MADHYMTILKEDNSIDLINIGTMETVATFQTWDDKAQAMINQILYVATENVFFEPYEKEVERKGFDPYEKFISRKGG